MSSLYQFAVIGNYGRNTANAAAVARMVAAWKPLFVITTGGNILDSTATTVSEADVGIGPNYHQFINPYVGSFGAGDPVRNKFWPAFSANESVSSPLVAAFLNYFTAPLYNSQPYYDHIEGPVHFFFLDTTSDNVYTSAQGEWLQTKLALSPCRYRIVIASAAPYSSDSPHPPARWPYAMWGATLVLSGCAGIGSVGSVYERLLTNGLNYIVNYAGGGNDTNNTAFVPIPISIYGTHAYYGAQLVTVNCDSLQLDFYSVDGTIRDTLLLQ